MSNIALKTFFLILIIKPLGSAQFFFEYFRIVKNKYSSQQVLSLESQEEVIKALVDFSIVSMKFHWWL